MTVNIYRSSEHKQLPDGSFVTYICVDFPGKTTYVEINLNNELELEHPHWDFLSHFYPLPPKQMAFFQKYGKQISEGLKGSCSCKIEVEDAD